MEEEKKSRKGGIKSKRASSGRKPTYACDNCKCSRYSPCGCERSESRKKKDEAAKSAVEAPTELKEVSA